MSSSRHFLPTFCIGLLLMSGHAFGQSDKAKKIDEFISQFVTAGQFGGVVIASENGKVIYEKAFGLANAEHRVPNQLNTRIGIASITKPMTVVILNRLVETGKIAPADKLNKFIPDFPNGEKITIDMIARHRSGIRHRVMPPEAESVAYTTAEFVEKVKQSPLAFEPGSERLYSSGGYAVLARVLEISSGKTYSQLLEEYVFKPAGMTDSMDYASSVVMERKAQDYFFSPEGLVPALPKDYSFLVGAGSVYSTARDVHRFGEALIDGKYGETAKASLVGETGLAASGSTNGHRSVLGFDRGKKYGYAVVSNLTGGFDLIDQGIKEILEGKPLAVKRMSFPKIIPNPNKDLKEFAGRYKRTDNGGETEIVVKDGTLFSSDIRLFPVRPDCFFEYRFYGNVCFVRETSGKIKEISWKGVNFDITWIKQ